MIPAIASAAFCQAIAVTSSRIAEKGIGGLNRIRTARRRDRSGHDRLSVVFALAAIERRDSRSVGTGRQGVERLFAPLGHGTLVSKPHAKCEQLAEIGGRCGGFR